ncbi:schwannomin-interacting protein 1-like isoform 1-T1 [Pholidichthys leucotaenia]
MWPVWELQPSPLIPDQDQGDNLLLVPQMEGVKEQWRQLGEEKESNEAEEDRRSDEDEDKQREDCKGAAMLWQEDHDEDNEGFPIMHWEALSLRIAELERQEQQKKEKKAKGGASLEQGGTPVRPKEERLRWGASCEDGDACNSHALALTSRLQTQMNLQLCFINNSESEDEDEDKKAKESKSSQMIKIGTVQVHNGNQPPAKSMRPKSRGFRSSLRKLRDRLRTNHKVQTAAGSDSVVQRKHLERSDLQDFCMEDLNSLCASLSQAIQDLSSELVGCLQVRDQLRTEQDAMLLEVQDLTSL